MQQDGGAELIAKANTLQAIRGASDDHPEAAKTGLAQALQYMRSDAKTLILLYADAPPHIKGEGFGRNGPLEQKALLDPKSYGGHGPLFADWILAAKTLRDGEKRCQVIPVLHFPYHPKDAAYFDFLASMTRGAAVHMDGSHPRIIFEVTVEVLLAWMGVKKEGAGSVSLPAKLSWYKDADFDGVKAEDELAAFLLFGNVIASQRMALTSTLLEERLPKKETPLRDCERSYKEDPAYRGVVTTHLRAIIERDVSAMSLNPVFGSLWRTFCNDKDNARRQDLLDLFGLKVNSIADADERARMKTWLEESYDYTTEVLEAIAQVPEDLQYPCVCLDPTLSYETAPQGDDEENEENHPITSFRRDELLELGRSCDYRILRRLGRVLTRLTFVESADMMPAHIAAAGQETVTRIPMALIRKIKRGTELGTCTLCFSTARKNLLQTSCGRSGCHQQICQPCLKSWYGLNAPGLILNTAALHCPFCRRAPAAKTLARHGMGVHAVAGLKEAVERRGKWVYAWCVECGCAKRYVERGCARGAPAYTRAWSCEECRERKEEGTVVRTKMCPGCGIETEKVSGCDRVQCVVSKCGVHWCFHCGEACEEWEIYEHMNEAHGGYYGDLEDDEEE